MGNCQCFKINCLFLRKMIVLSSAFRFFWNFFGHFRPQDQSCRSRQENNFCVLFSPSWLEEDPLLGEIPILRAIWQNTSSSEQRGTFWEAPRHSQQALGGISSQGEQEYLLSTGGQPHQQAVSLFRRQGDAGKCCPRHEPPLLWF